MNVLMKTLVLVIAMTAAAASAAENAGERAVAAAQSAREYRASHEKEILESYIGLLSLPNYGGNDADIRANAAHIRSMMEARGIATTLLESDGGAPAVYGELIVPGATETVVLYVHYDGQPALAENWATPPFTPTIRKGRLEDNAEIIAFDDLSYPMDESWRVYARSASDDKAPIIGVLTALDAMRAAGISPGVNLKFFFEGEEERGSPYLKSLLENNADLLRSDFWLFLDGPTDQRGNPRVVLGVRGSMGVNIALYGPRSGLHSGHYGNFAPNPALRLAHLIASMRDEDGRITIDGFYDDVPAPDARSMELLRAIPEADADIMAAGGYAGREHKGMRYEEAILWPALNVQGIAAGDVEDRARNVIVPVAKAHIGFRMVPNQTPASVREKVDAHIRARGYHIVREEPDEEIRRQYEKIAKVVWAEGYAAVRTPPENPWAARLIEVMQEVTAGGDAGEVIIYPSLGGSLPLAHITNTLGVPLAILPIANQDNSQHAPNENIRIGNLWRGIEYYAAVITALGSD